MPNNLSAYFLSKVAPLSLKPVYYEIHARHLANQHGRGDEESFRTD
jgi:hypothetical protein